MVTSALTQLVYSQLLTIHESYTSSKGFGVVSKAQNVVFFPPKWLVIHWQKHSNPVTDRSMYIVDKSDNNQLCTAYHLLDEPVNKNKQTCLHAHVKHYKLLFIFIEGKKKQTLNVTVVALLKHVHSTRMKREKWSIDTFVKVGNCCSRVLKWHPQWQALLMAYSVCERGGKKRICV